MTYYALTVGGWPAYMILAEFCIISLALRAMMIYTIFPSFTFYRNLFSLGCIGRLKERLQDDKFQITNILYISSIVFFGLSVSGCLYISFIYINTFGWAVAWSLVMGGVEGILCFPVPSLTCTTCPRHVLGSYWTWMGTNLNTCKSTTSYLLIMPYA